MGPAARDSAGDLTQQAIAYAYTAMATAVKTSLSVNPLVLAVGSFRSEDQRRQFREIGTLVDARVDHGTYYLSGRDGCPPRRGAEG